MPFDNFFCTLTKHTKDMLFGDSMVSYCVPWISSNSESTLIWGASVDDVVQYTLILILLYYDSEH